jgi:hypothetical protein
MSSYDDRKKTILRNVPCMLTKPRDSANAHIQNAMARSSGFANGTKNVWSINQQQNRYSPMERANAVSHRNHQIQEIGCKGSSHAIQVALVYLNHRRKCGMRRAGKTIMICRTSANRSTARNPRPAMPQTRAKKPEMARAICQSPTPICRQSRRVKP